MFGRGGGGEYFAAPLLHTLTVGLCHCHIGSHKRDGKKHSAHTSRTVGFRDLKAEGSVSFSSSFVCLYSYVIHINASALCLFSNVNYLNSRALSTLFTHLIIN